MRELVVTIEDAAGDAQSTGRISENFLPGVFDGRVTRRSVKHWLFYH
jgi:hypothetical protein